MNRMGLVMMTLALSASSLAAPPPPRRDAAQVLQQLRQLSVVGSVLYVAAHPDDENTRLLATLARESMVRTAYLSFTRGEGGQNLIGPELGPLLGVIRTQELLAARRLDGAEQFFTRARDFGYSKSVDETLAIWDHDRVLADVVWVLRTLRPDVVITRFDPDGSGTHGHHIASARLALEAFHAAADPAFHPEQLSGAVTLWQARRIVWNAWAPGGLAKLPADSVTWDSSLFNPLLGYAYGELAAESRSMHKSQGFGAAPVHGPHPEHFAPLAGEKAQRTIFDGIDLSWKRVAGAEKLAALLARAASEFKVESPAASVPVLRLALEELRRLPPNPWTAHKERELVDALVDCAGLFLEATADRFSAVPGAQLVVSTTALNRTAASLTLEAVRVGSVAVSPAAPLVRGQAQQHALTVEVPSRLSSPSWLAQEPGRGTWTLAEGQASDAPEDAPPLQAEFTLGVGPLRVVVRRDVAFKWVDPIMGERFRPLEVLPPVVVKPGVELLAFTDGAAKTLEVTVTAQADAQVGALRLEVPPGFVVTPASAPFSLGKKGEVATLRFTVKVKGKVVSDALASLTAVATVGDAQHALALSRVDYPHVPMQTVLAPATVKLLQLRLRRGKTKKVGYIVGAGDDVPAALRQVGYEVTLLDDAALEREALGRYEAIVVGIRAYNTNPRLPAVQGRLLQYVQDGGTLLVQYNTRNWLSAVPTQLGPLPFELSQDRVTDETAPVAFTAPVHPLLRAPNALGPADFTGWVQERGLYFAAKWDARYETPLAMNDPGEPASRGSLLTLRHGKGRFVYTGLSFFRQLPAGVPGAYRLFANLLDHGR